MEQRLRHHLLFSFQIVRLPLEVRCAEGFFLFPEVEDRCPQLFSLTFAGLLISNYLIELARKFSLLFSTVLQLLMQPGLLTLQLVQLQLQSIKFFSLLLQFLVFCLTLLQHVLQFRLKADEIFFSTLLKFQRFLQGDLNVVKFLLQRLCHARVADFTSPVSFSEQRHSVV